MEAAIPYKNSAKSISHEVLSTVLQQLNSHVCTSFHFCNHTHLISVIKMDPLKLLWYFQNSFQLSVLSDEDPGCPSLQKILKIYTNQEIKYIKAMAPYKTTQATNSKEQRPSGELTPKKFPIFH